MASTPPTPSPRELPGPHPAEAFDRLNVESPYWRLLEELDIAWEQGRELTAAELLAAHPEFAHDSEVAVRLIYEELLLRQEAGQRGASVEVLGRYPRYRRRLEMLLECHRLLDGSLTFPVCGESLGPFRLVAELGRGARGRVYLATESSLADRVLVLKVTPRAGGEHLALARLQHTSIVPLYQVQDFPELGLQALCMPYLGGLTLAALLNRLKDRPPGERTGGDVLALLDEAEAAAPVPVPSRGVPARQALATASFAEVMCRLAVGLADGLQYAHERGLVHLDLKPDNVLLAADGQPMLLDFHLARAPFSAAEEAPGWLGGTPGYMAPEQEAALEAVRRGNPVPQTVDGRADVFALGVILFESLTGAPAVPEQPARELRRNPQVSPGLAGLIARCLEADPARRYATPGALAADLRRHLANQPLQGVANDSLLERWNKWRRRRPTALSLLGLALMTVLACAAGNWFRLGEIRQRRQEAADDLTEGRQLLSEHQHDGARRACIRGLARLSRLPWSDDLRGQLEHELRRAERGQAADRLHGVADQLRFAFGSEAVPKGDLVRLTHEAEQVWADRVRLTDRQAAPLDAGLEERIRTDLLDLAVLWADVRVRRLAPDDAEEERRAALAVLREAEALGGSSPVLDRARHALTREEAGGAARSPRSAWEHYALGRALLQDGRLAEAEAAFRAALALQPGDFWSNFYQGLCCYRLRRYADARVHFSICVALAPGSAECYHNRALALAALEQPEAALTDYTRALDLNPNLAGAALNRGLLHLQARRYAEAEADLERALRLGADPVRTHFALALVRLAQDNRAAALRHLDEVLRTQPQHEEALKLAETLRRRTPDPPR
jgi:serine/threonine protein kinase/Flp pilus assembly protein TadD